MSLRSVDRSPSLYFAYGSNLNAADWTRWCTERGVDPAIIQPIGIGYLPDHDLAFRYRSRSRRGGVLDVVARRGQLVPGVLFSLSANALDALDVKEGRGTAYDRSEISVLRDDGSEVRALTYRVLKPERFVAPHPEYLGIVRDGLAGHGLSPDQLNEAAADSRPTLITDLFFFYGTLMRGESRFSIIRDLDPSLVLMSETFGRLVDCGPFPGLEMSGGHNPDLVRGEQTLADVEQLERWASAMKASLPSDAELQVCWKIKRRS